MTEILEEYIHNLISFIKGKKIVITTHDLADIDAVASAFALKLFLENFFHKELIDIRIPNCSKPTKQIISEIKSLYPCILENTFNVEACPDLLIVTDTNNIDKTNLSAIKIDPEEMIPNIIFIDHHIKGKDNDNSINEYNMVLEEYTSSSEMILDFFRIFKFTIKPCLIYLLSAGILKDTGNFKHANNRTFESFNFLLQKGVDYQILRDIMNLDLDLSKKIANIKGAQRSELIRCGEWLMCITRISNYEASVASSLKNLGCDVAVVVSKSKKGEMFRITARANHKVIKEKGINIGELFSSLSNNENLSGGGHKGAGTLSGEKNIDETIQIIITHFKKKLIRD